MGMACHAVHCACSPEADAQCWGVQHWLAASACGPDARTVMACEQKLSASAAAAAEQGVDSEGSVADAVKDASTDAHYLWPHYTASPRQKRRTQPSASGTRIRD